MTHACHASRAHLVVTDSQCIKKNVWARALGGKEPLCVTSTFRGRAPSRNPLHLPRVGGRAHLLFPRVRALEKSVTFTEGRAARPSTFFEGARPREICYVRYIRYVFITKTKSLADGHTPDYCGSTTPWSTWSTLFHNHRLGTGNRAGLQNQPAG